MNLYTEIPTPNYQRVLKVINNTTKLNAIIAVHNTNLGPALGGCRAMTYIDDQAMLNDALRLSEGMTYKNAIAGLDLGGGKSVINLMGYEITKELLKSFGEAMNYINYANVVYYTAGDIGMGPQETKTLNTHTQYVNRTEGHDSGYATAYGVHRAINAALDFTGRDYDKANIVITGAGKVGRRLAKFLGHRYKGVVMLDVEDIHRLPGLLSNYADVYAPCAIGGIVNSDTIKDMRDGLIICGGANNQLSSANVNPLLKEKNITYVPDYIANSGGVIIVAENIIEDHEYNDPVVKPKLDYIKTLSREILERAKREDKPTSVIADTIAEERWRK